MRVEFSGRTHPESDNEDNDDHDDDPGPVGLVKGIKILRVGRLSLVALKDEASVSHVSILIPCAPGQ